MGYNYLQQDNEELNYRGEQVEQAVCGACTSFTSKKLLEQNCLTISSFILREDQDNLQT